MRTTTSNRNVTATQILRGLMCLLLAILGLALTACQINSYEQEAGVTASGPSGEAIPEVQVTYNFDPATSELVSVTLDIAGAETVSLLDGSRIVSKTLLSKSEITAMGKREGMLNNNAGLEGKAVSEAKLAEALERVDDIIRNIKAPVTIATGVEDE